MRSHFGFSFRFGYLSAIAASVLPTAIVLSGCSFPSYTFTDEDCFNGIDDDGNGKVDCEDPGCQSVVKCVDTPPPTQGWAGPVTVWQGPDISAAPSCDGSAYPHTLFSALYQGPQRGEESCPQCSCSISPNASAPKCMARLQLSDSRECSGSRQLMLGPDNKNGFVVASECTAVNVDTSQFTPQTAFFSDPYPVDDSCVPHETGVEKFAPPTYQVTLKVCDMQGVNTLPGGCAENKKCAPKPSAQFGSYVCVYKQSDDTDPTCPNYYSSSKFAFHEYSDDRQCSPCTCQATGISCNPTKPGSLGIFSTDPFCAANVNDVPTAGGCTQAPSATTIYAKASYVTVSGSGGNCQASVSTVQNEISALHTYTFCCTQFN